MLQSLQNFNFRYKLYNMYCNVSTYILLFIKKTFLSFQKLSYFGRENSCGIPKYITSIQLTWTSSPFSTKDCGLTFWPEPWFWAGISPHFGYLIFKIFCFSKKSPWFQASCSIFQPDHELMTFLTQLYWNRTWIF